MQSGPSGVKSVLVVEDDRDIRETLTTLLGSDGYLVGACANGREALETLRRGRPTDVILLDLMMPIMDGWEFRVRQKEDPRLASIPVLVLSADGTPKATAIDADGYLRKPIDYAALIRTIERTLVAAERAKLQAALVETEKLASLGTLAAGLAHEINNPLTYLTANLDFIAEAVEASAGVHDVERVRTALSESRDGCERIRVIVRDLQLFSRTPDDDEREVDVRALLDSSANIVMNEIRVRATLLKDYEPVPLVVTNPARLGQVFLNLVLNAAQAIAPGGSGTNEIRLTTRSRDGRVIVGVKDTGEGIDPEVRARIFDPFFTTKPLGVGTGLGLSICHRIVTAMGGELAVESTPGRGSTFSVYIPVRTSRPVKVAPAPPLPTPQKTETKARILVIDDEVMIGNLLKRVLGELYAVEAMTHPDQAVQRIRSGERFDLVLCDITMPGRTGIEVHEAIRAISPEQADAMMFLTGGALNEGARSFLSARESSVITKPFAMAEIQRRIAARLAASAPEPRSSELA
jgi:signal transduction histidine kinase